MHAGSADSCARNVFIDLHLLQQSWAMSLTFFFLGKIPGFCTQVSEWMWLYLFEENIV